MRCKKNNDLKESIFKNVGKVIKNLLSSLEVQCQNQTCKKIMLLDEYNDHEYMCYLPKCSNTLCQKASEKLKNYNNSNKNEFNIDKYISNEESLEKNLLFCDYMCKISHDFQNIINSTKDINSTIVCKWFDYTLHNDFDDKKIHIECEKRIENLKSMIKSLSGNNPPINDLQYSPGITQFKWDNNKKGQGIQIYNNGESLLLNESCYAFRTVLSNVGFTSGVHYWEIIADKRTENELKIGISKSLNFNYDNSFSDYNFGWAFYGVGQLRHGSNASGDLYGKKFKKVGVLGVFLDMERGILSFALDGEYFGIACQSNELKEGPIYPAVSLLHIGGCTLVTNIPAPLYFFGDY